MVSLFVGHVVVFSAFPIYFATLQPLPRRVYFYLYLALILLIGGFLGNAYALQLSEGVSVSGGNLCYGAFMMTSVLFVLIERDIFLLRRVIRLVVIVDLFNIAFSLLATTALSDAQVSNPHGTPAALFAQSVPLIVLGGVLIVAELFALFFWFEQIKRARLGAQLVGLAYLAGFVAVLCLDGIMFPLIAFGVSPEIVAIVWGGLDGKVLTATAYAVPLLLFMVLWRKRFTQYLETDVFTWRVFVATSSELIRELSDNDRALRQADAVFRASSDGLAVLGADGSCIRANAAFTRLTGAPDRPAARWFRHRGTALALPPETGGAWRGEVSFGPEGQAQGILSVTPVAVVGDLEATFVCSLADITEQKRIEAELDHLAMHDALTGLPNRRALDAALARVSPPAALAILDLDRFKDVNDSYGHLAGDDLLRKVSYRLRDALPTEAEGALFRIGGDEFALLLQGAGEAELRATVARITRILALPFTLSNGAEVALMATFGGSLGAGAAGSDLFAEADAALYDVKHGHRGSLGIYQDRLTVASKRRLALSLRLRRALEAQMRGSDAPHQGALELAYQPQIDREGRVCGLEALVRWNDPELGQISPAEFIPLAEEQGLIGALGLFVLHTACRAGESWRAAAVPIHKIAVNVSGLQLRNPSFVQQVQSVLAQTGLAAGGLELELTESAFLGRESEVLPVFEALKALGVRLAVDDFGTGYSSMSYLPVLPWDTLKIDRSFLALAPDNPRRNVLIEAMARMARGLGLRVVVEGVEARDQHAVLMDCGCDAFQGFLFARPLPEAEVAAFCATRTEGAARHVSEKDGNPVPAAR
ncbi:diguanylate cyclase (GGDEF)-like protein [Rhodobacter sp. JA431]|uniref:putative bifunctional diguanylate cyclase/phosphodiesterase n=1 Tax=Rhodobacter sp. JA431 TaxID=570013 RepID=UPI000BD06FCC|nr:bifunctional diguanylate cyclase/phosphodiesterase [Rhodobacter sp. JA431]SOC21490.1 diguanylate cyclase (GGDEF)-like protein [Rhodobacter sp. JA431]